MTDKNINELVGKCETILRQVESHASSIEKMYSHMLDLIEQNNQLQNQLLAAQQEEMNQQVIKLARKAAKKAAKKSITKANIRENLKDRSSQ